MTEIKPWLSRLAGVRMEIAKGCSVEGCKMYVDGTYRPYCALDEPLIMAYALHPNCPLRKGPVVLMLPEKE